MDEESHIDQQSFQMEMPSSTVNLTPEGMSSYAPKSMY